MIYRTYFLAFFLAFLPAASQALLVSDLIYEDTLQPNMSKVARINLFNDRDRPEKIHLKLYHYSCNSEGQHFFEETSEIHPRSNASWIQLSTDYLVLAPGERQDFYYTIQVPSQIDLKGSYWSVLMIEPADEMSNNTSQEGFKLNIKIRFAHHIVTHVGEGKVKINIFKKEIVDLDGQKMYSIHVSNEGEQFLNPKLTLKLYDATGALISTLDGGKERLYPGCSQRYSIDVQNIPDGPYKGFLILDNGDHHLFGEHLTYPSKLS